MRLALSVVWVSVIACAGARDPDGDGLTNAEEAIYGTNPDDPDTDGDGFDDGEEVILRNFDPETDPFTFNPLIADTPVLAVEIAGPPAIALIYETVDGNAITVSNERQDSWETSRSTTTTNALSTAVEDSWSVTAGVESTVSLTPSVSVSLETTVGRTTTREESFEWSTSQETANGAALTEGRTVSETNDVITSGGYLAVPLTVANQGALAFTLDNLLLSATEYLRGPEGEGALSPITALEYDIDNQNTFPSFTLAPGESTSPLVFEADLDLGTTEALLANSSNLEIAIGTFEITGFDGRPFAFSNEIIQASTANIVIDYGPDVPTDEFLIATRLDDADPGVWLGNVLRDVLRIPFEIGEIEGVTTLTSVTNRRGDTGEPIEANPAEGRVWTVLQTSLDEGVRRARFYRGQTDLDLDALRIQARDVIYLMYIVDRDGDGLGERQEFAYGSDPELADTDGDGWDDFVEAIEEGTRPDLPDTDGDGLIDPEDPDPLVPGGMAPPSVGPDNDGDGVPDDVEAAWRTDPNHPNTDRDALPDAIDPFPLEPWRENLALDREHAAVILNDGTLATTGSEETWELLGNGPPQDHEQLTVIESENRWLQVSAAWAYTLALRVDGTMWGFGWLPPYVTAPESVRLSQIGEDDDWWKVAAGWNRAVALKRDGTLWTWGSIENSFELIDVVEPTQVGTDDDWLYIDTASTGFFAVKTDGTLWSWGLQDMDRILGLGELGLSNPDPFDPVPLPIQIGTEDHWVFVDAGFDHVVALTEDGQAFTWGSGDQGQLGTVNPGWQLFVSAPQAVLGTGTPTGSEPKGEEPAPLVTVSAGDLHNVGLTAAGEVYFWGSDDSGLDGDGERFTGVVTRAQPVPIGPDAHPLVLRSVVGGGESVLGIGFDFRAGGAFDVLIGWGQNSDHQLSLPSPSLVDVPTVIEPDDLPYIFEMVR
ncbi:MAG: hypothetical protein AAGA48_09455 [Myxococcota bacterium]